MTKVSTSTHDTTRTTRLALRGMDSSDAGVVLRFGARGQAFSWEFKAATFDELVALALGGRVGLGRDVHFDAARVSYKKGVGRKPGSVRIAIGRKVRIVAPAPVRGRGAAAARKAAGETPVRKSAVKKAAIRKTRARRKLPAA